MHTYSFSGPPTSSFQIKGKFYTINTRSSKLLQVIGVIAGLHSVFMNVATSRSLLWNRHLRGVTNYVHFYFGMYILQISVYIQDHT